MKKYSKYFAIEKKLKASGMSVDRADLIADFTEGRTDSLTGLSETDYREFTNHLSKVLSGQTFTPPKGERMRKKVIAILCQCGYVKNEKADMPRINEWCKKHGHKHVELNAYKLKELTQLVYQAEQMYKHEIEAL
jgi:hypothetical protein